MCVPGAQAGYRAQKWAMEPGQGPLLLWTMEDTANAERDCPCVLGFQVNDKMNVPAPAYQRRAGQPRWQGRWECLRR